MLAATTSPVAELTGTALFGTGFGVVQTATLTLMYGRVPRPSHGTGSALWNLADDGGMGIGAAGFSLLKPHTGYAWGCTLTALLIPTAPGPATRDRPSAP
ncbi:hypothetical protein [Streptomyces collinus]|uniref:hypothetical protein n=1 Tax=Streptomyces collinus TaxID=42684 RepID=UPI002943A20B|nr:hypothetical protein [Streptomyces collinus]